jgi:hypothetical protein
LIRILPAIHPYHFFLGITQYSTQRFIEKGKVAGKVHFKIAILDVLQDGSIFFLTLTEGFFCAFPLGDIYINGQDSRLTIVFDLRSG